MKFMNKNKKGFTLVELMIVVVIMAILVAVAVPIYNAVTKNAKEKTCAANAKTIGGQVNALMLDTVGVDTTTTALSNTVPLTATIEIASIVPGAKAATSFATYFQSGAIPTCPFTNTVTYIVQLNGKVVCSGVQAADGKHAD